MKAWMNSSASILCHVTLLPNQKFQTLKNKVHHHHHHHHHHHPFLKVYTESAISKVISSVYCLYKCSKIFLLSSKISETDSAVFVRNLKFDKNRKNLLEVFKSHINHESSNSILDDFLQENLITVEKHKEISEMSRTLAAEKLLVAMERSCSLKLLSILESYGAQSLAASLRQQEEEMNINGEKGGGFFVFAQD